MRSLRMALSLALLAALLLQSIVAFAAPREARMGGREPIWTPTEFTPRAPQRTVGQPARYVPGYVEPARDAKDPRHC